MYQKYRQLPEINTWWLYDLHVYAYYIRKVLRYCRCSKGLNVLGLVDTCTCTLIDEFTSDTKELPYGQHLVILL